MYNTKFILENGKELYPGYLDKEQRKRIKDKFNDKREYMHCGCKSATTEKLFYRISEDLKIYPEHKNYVHDIYCCRYKDEMGDVRRQTAYVINDDDGEVTVYTSFNPKIFDTNEESEKEQDNVVSDSEEILDEITIEKDGELIKTNEKKEPKLSLSGLIRSINVDSFTEKILNNRTIESKEKFSTYVYHRMKKVRMSRTKKSMGDLSLEKDGVRFVYLPFEAAIEKTDNGYSRCYLQTKGPDGKTYNNYVFPDTMQKVMKQFEKQYGGIQPNENTVMAGFQYLKKTKGNNTYKVMGRVHIFQVSDIGLYCRSMTEYNVFNDLHRIVNEDDNINFWIPPEDESIGGIIEIKGKNKKILLIFKGKKSETVSYDSSIYIPLVADSSTVITKEMLYDMVD